MFRSASERLGNVAGGSAYRTVGEGASGATTRFFVRAPFSGREISGCDAGKHGIFQEVFRTIFPWNDVHRTVTVVSRGLRHWGGSTWARDFFPIAITITIS